MHPNLKRSRFNRSKLQNAERRLHKVTYFNGAGEALSDDARRWACRSSYAQTESETSGGPSEKVLRFRQRVTLVVRLVVNATT